MNVPRNCRYSRDHFWVKPEGNEALIGLSDYLQEELGEILTVDLPEVDDDIEVTGTFGIVESTRIVSDLSAPVTGTVVSSIPTSRWARSSSTRTLTGMAGSSGCSWTTQARSKRS